jgi:thiol:disulfide interchange protein
VMRGYFNRAVEQAIAKQMLTLNATGTGMVEAPVERRPSVWKKARLSWQPYTRKTLEAAVAAGSTVLVDFTADWCLTCKALEAAVLNTQEVCDVVAANRIVTLHADWTHADPEVTRMLEALGSKQVPVLAIFPADNPNAPIVLRGGYTQQVLLDALKQAGPSKRQAVTRP